MKKPLLVVITSMLFCVSSFAQQNPNPLAFVTVETVDSSTTKETLYLNGVEWVGKHFASASKVIQIADKDAGLLLVKGSFNYQAPGNILSGVDTRLISFMLKLSFKDGRYKIEMSDFRDEALGLITDADYQDEPTLKKTMQKQWKAAQQQTQSNMVAVHKSIKEFMEQNINW
jgi:hypothetical protein